MKRLFAALFFVVLYAGHLNAQDSWDLAMASGDTLKGCQVVSVSDSLVAVTRGQSHSAIPVDSITSVFSHMEGHFWTGALIGTIVGAAAGGAIGSSTYKAPKAESNGFFAGSPTGGLGKGLAAAGGVFIGGVAGFVVGGLIGGNSHSDKEIDLSHRSHTARVMILMKLAE